MIRLLSSFFSKSSSKEDLSSYALQANEPNDFSNFFSDTNLLNYLESNVWVSWMKNNSTKKRYHVLFIGASTGERVFCLAGLLSKVLGENFKISSIEKDLAKVSVAKNSVYQSSKVAGIPKLLADQYTHVGSEKLLGWTKFKDVVRNTIEYSTIQNFSSKRMAQEVDLIWVQDGSENIKLISPSLTDQSCLVWADKKNRFSGSAQDWTQVSDYFFERKRQSKDSTISHSKGSKSVSLVKTIVGKNISEPQIKLGSKSVRPALKVEGIQERPKEYRKRKVLIVDDSKTITQLLRKIFSADPEFEVVAEVNDPLEVEAAIVKFQPDVMTLDIHMPVMDGPQVLEKVLPKTPIPVVMISSISMEEGPQVLHALELGAVDYIQKPSMSELGEQSKVIIEKVKAASFAKVQRKNARKKMVQVNKTLAQESIKSQLVAIGSSTGGTEALRFILTHLPAQIPPIVIVQHIPPVFSKTFADRMNSICEFEVKEADDGDDVLPSRVLIAPGGKHMAVEKVGIGLKVRILDTEPVNRHKPSVDVLFESVAKVSHLKSVGIILTGMGGDGSKGLLKMKEAGSLTMAQNEESCVVFGMPKEAIKLGAADEILALQDIPETLLIRLNQLKKTA